MTGAIEQNWPYDGPHTPDTVSEAAGALYDLVRYLNNATGPGNAERTLPYVASTYRVLSNVSAAVALLEQLLRQLSDVTHRQAQDPTLYDDRRDRPGSATANDVWEQLGVASRTVLLLADQLGAAVQSAGHLGNDVNRGSL